MNMWYTYIGGEDCEVVQEEMVEGDNYEERDPQGGHCDEGYMCVYVPSYREESTRDGERPWLYVREDCVRAVSTSVRGMI